MRLARIEVRNFKRFRDPVDIRITGKLTAVVGANEAGKTSLLKAIEHVTTLDPFEAGGDGAEISRGSSPAPTDILVEVFFVLDKSDRSLVSGIEGAEKLRWLAVGQRRDGEIVKTVIPELTRNLDARARSRKELARLVKSPSLEHIADDDEKEEEEEFDVLELANGCLSALSSGDETLESVSIEQVDQLADFLSRHSSELPKYAAQLGESLNRLSELEQLPPPSSRAANVLWENSPDFLFYRDEDRTLASAYTLPSIAQGPPASLRNLAGLAGLDVMALEVARTSDDRGGIETLLERANRQLRDAMRSWGQGTVSVRFRLDGEILRILVETERAGFWTLEDRSDGLRAFIALRAFLGARPPDAVPPILLIDEAETHLHYDAQADLIQVLTLQQLVPQIIYTTHSAGCLPEDLASVRTVRPNGAETSTVDNWFWQGEDPGMASLLLGMGAATMAFVPTRYAVIGEGAADVILLPTLLREVSDSDSLGFQVVPGGAEVSGAEVTALKRQAPRVIWAVDNDDGGRDNASKLKADGVPDERILTVCRSPFQTLEDLVTPNRYLQAVNTELEAAGRPTMNEEDLAGYGRATSVRTWCDSQGFSPVSQRAIAHNLLDIATRLDGGLLSEEGRNEAELLLDAVRSLFGAAD